MAKLTFPEIYKYSTYTKRIYISAVNLNFTGFLVCTYLPAVSMRATIFAVPEVPGISACLITSDGIKSGKAYGSASLEKSRDLSS